MGQDFARANACLRESLRLSAELDSIREMAVAIAALPLVAAASGQAERACRLAGAVQALLDRAGCDLPTFLAGEYDRGLGNLRERVGPSVFEAWFSTGLRLTTPQIVDEANSGSDAAAVEAIAEDGQSIEAKGEMSKNGQTWEPDLQLTYSRVS